MAYAVGGRGTRIDVGWEGDPREARDSQWMEQKEEEEADRYTYCVAIKGLVLEGLISRRMKIC
jgi:hypothetical protein